jgi:hypothetical protein
VYNTKEFISNKFHSLQIGKVSHIHFITKQNKYGAKYNQAFIFFDYWYDNVASLNIYKQVNEGNRNVRLVYNEPRYWLLVKNKRVSFKEKDPKGDKVSTPLSELIVTEWFPTAVISREAEDKQERKWKEEQDIQEKEWKEQEELWLGWIEKQEALRIEQQEAWDEEDANYDFWADYARGTIKPLPTRRLYDKLCPFRLQ